MNVALAPLRLLRRLALAALALLLAGGCWRSAIWR